MSSRSTASASPPHHEEPLGRPVDPARAWRSADFAGDEDWITRLSNEEIDALEQMADALPARCADWVDFDVLAQTPARLRDRLAQLASELRDGKGFLVLRGLDARDQEKLRRMFWIVGNHMGTPAMQNARGEILSEVFDRFAGAERGPDTRGYESNDELRFHCDGGDCIGLGCVRQSPTGGESGLVSLLAIYNELLANHPEHLAALYHGFPLYVRKEKEGDGGGTREASIQARPIPVFASQNGRMSAWVNMVLAELAAEMSGEAMSVEGRAALDQLEEIAERPEMKLSFRLQEGDIMWIDNLSVMHRRNRYEDAPEPDARRRFYRMWTNLHEPRDVVREYEGLRRGIQGPSPVVVGP